MKLTPKQTIAFDLLQDQQTTEVLFGGGAGGGKSALGCVWLLQCCIQYPGSRWLMGRSKLKNLKETTLNTFWDICKKVGLPPGMIQYNSISSTITFPAFGHSQIILKDLFLYPSDPEFDSLGSLEITGAFVDECNQITHKAQQIVRSRIRYRLDDFGLLPKWLGTCNPAKNWVYTHFYKPYTEGSLPEGRRFVPSLLSDNPYVTPHYEAMLRQLDTNSRERLLHGNWDYDDDPAALISYEAIEDLWTNQHVPKGKMYLTADIALHGSDRFVVCVWAGFVLIDLIVTDKVDGKGAEKLLTHTALKYSIPQSRICYDADGVGSYLQGYLKNAKPFLNGGKPVPRLTDRKNPPQYANLKSQCYFRMAQRMNEGGYFIACDTDRWTDIIKKELGLVKNASYGTDRKLAVLSKERLKQDLGGSPDFADALMMREYFELQGGNPFDEYF
jgi:hypothetical protein